jgi:hypothetical protein
MLFPQVRIMGVQVGSRLRNGNGLRLAGPGVGHQRNLVSTPKPTWQPSFPRSPDRASRNANPASPTQPQPSPPRPPQYAWRCAATLSSWPSFLATLVAQALIIARGLDLAHDPASTAPSQFGSAIEIQRKACYSQT